MPFNRRHALVGQLARIVVPGAATLRAALAMVCVISGLVLGLITCIQNCVMPVLLARQTGGQNREDVAAALKAEA
jgi:hypothetical protein